MATVEQSDVAKWVEDQMRLLDTPTDWQPNPEDALKRFRRHTVHRPAPVSVILRPRVVVVTLLLAVLLTNFVLAQRFFDRHLFRSIEVLHLNLEARMSLAAKAMRVTYVAPPPAPHSISTWDDLERDAGFSADPAWRGTLRELYSMFRLDPLWALEHARWLRQIGMLGLWRPTLAVRDPSILEIHIDVAAMKVALASTGNGGVPVPSGWDGAVIRIESSPTIVLQYRGGQVPVEQSLHRRVIAPSGVSMPALAEMLLKILGTDSSKAGYLRRKLSADPSLLLFLPPSAVEIHEVPFGPETMRVKEASGVVIRNVGGKGEDCVHCPGPSELVMIWNTFSRRYAVKGQLTEDQAGAIAHSFQK